MKKATHLLLTLLTASLTLLLAGCLTPSPKKAATLSGSTNGTYNMSKAPAPPSADRGVNASTNPGDWSSSASLPPSPAPSDLVIEQSGVAANAATETPVAPEPELADGAPTPDQLARELQAMNTPPKAAPPEPVQPRFLAPTPVDPQPAAPTASPASPTPPTPPTPPTSSVSVSPPGMQGGLSPFQGSVVVDPASSEPVIPSVDDIANEYRALQTTP